MPPASTVFQKVLETLIPQLGVRQIILDSDQQQITDSIWTDQWCLSQKNTCKLLCGGSQYAANNACDGVSLPKYQTFSWPSTSISTPFTYPYRTFWRGKQNTNSSPLTDHLNLELHLRQRQRTR